MNVLNNASVRIDVLLKEARSISAKKAVTKSDELRHIEIMAEIKGLRHSMSSKEFQGARLDAILAEAGLSELPRNVSASTELRNAWVDFIKTGNNFGLPEFRDFKQNTQWGRVNGLTFSDFSGDGLGTQGGTLVPPDYDARLFGSLGAVDEIVLDGNCTVYKSSHGSASTTPAVDDTFGTSPAAAVASQRISEAVRSTQPGDSGAAVQFSAVNWGSVPTYRSGIVYASIELDQDSMFGLAMVLEQVFARRHALAFGQDMIKGSGTLQVGVTETVPLGLTTSLPSANVITTASSGVIALSDLENVYAQLPFQYRNGAKFYCSDTTALVIAKLVETANRNNYGGSLDYLFNKQIVRCNSMNSFTNGAASVIVFANPDYILRREVIGGQYIRRFTESTNAVESGLVGFQGFARFDARPILLGSALAPYSSLNVKP